MVGGLQTLQVLENKAQGGDLRAMEELSKTALGDNRGARARAIVDSIDGNPPKKWFFTPAW